MSKQSKELLSPHGKEDIIMYSLPGKEDSSLQLSHTLVLSNVNSCHRTQLPPNPPKLDKSPS